MGEIETNINKEWDKYISLYDVMCDVEEIEQIWCNYVFMKHLVNKFQSHNHFELD